MCYNLLLMNFVRHCIDSLFLSRWYYIIELVLEVTDEEDMHALVKTPAQTAETTPPSAVRQTNLQSPSNITEQSSTKAKILDRYVLGIR